MWITFFKKNLDGITFPPYLCISQLKLKVMSEKVVVHQFVDTKGFSIVIPRVVDEHYQHMVDLMNQTGPHGGIVESVIWQSKDPNFEWKEEVYAHLSSLIIVKEQIKTKDRFNKKLTLRDQEVALLDYIQGCGSTGKYKEMRDAAEALIAIKPDTRTIFQFQ